MGWHEDVEESYIQYTSSKVDSNDAFTVKWGERERGRMNIKHCKSPWNDLNM